MKKFIPTLVLVIVCIGAFWYAGSQHFFQAKTPEKNLIKVKKDDITTFTVHSAKSKQDLVFAKSSGKWAMTAPDGIPLDATSVDAWLNTISSLTYENIVEQKAQDLAGFGLASPAQQYRIKLADGTDKVLLVGDEMPVSGFHYVKLQGSSAVYKMADASIDQLNQDELYFLNKDATSFSYPQFISLDFSWQGQAWKLQKADAKKSIYDTDFKLGDKTLPNTDGSNLVDKFLFLQTDQMVKPADQVSVDQPDFTVQLTLQDTSQGSGGNPQTLQYTAKLDKDTVWIKGQNAKWAYGVPLKSVQDIVRAFQQAEKTAK